MPLDRYGYGYVVDTAFILGNRPSDVKLTGFSHFFAQKKPRYGYGAGIGSPAPFVIILYSLRRTENTG